MIRQLVAAFSLATLLASPASAGTDWTGSYIGLALGYVDANDAWDETTDPSDPVLSPEGASFSVFAGYGVDVGGIVLGLEGDLSFPDLSDNATCEVLIDCTLDVELMTSMRARAGLAIGATQFYGTAGVSLGYIQADSDEIGGSSASKSLAGWTIGAGVEQQIADSLRFGIEYRHSNFGNDDVDLGTPTGDLSLETDEVRLRIALVF